ncbi:MAG: hypothetical protein JXA61_01270 [Bacteroidales bacterium]|nr:hypothetical protein [Bacteroidales bacterium]
MKIKTIITGMLILSATAALGQGKVSAVINLKDGNTIDVYHFGRLMCESNRYAETYTLLRGKYFNSPTEINDYSDISQLLFSGFTDPPAASVGNQKGTITAVRKDGVRVALDDAELVMSCFGPGDKYNQIRVQVLNPLTQEAVDRIVEMQQIESVVFK